MFKLVIIDHQLELVTMPKRKRDIGRTYLSGNEKRKIKIAKENEAKNLCGAMEKFVVKKMLDVGEASEDSDSESVVTPSQEDILDDTAPAEPSHPTSPLVEIEPDHHVIGFISNHSDPATWPEFLTAAQRDYLITKGPSREQSNFEYPKDNTGRKFSVKYYSRRLSNGELINRKWLVFSKSKQKIFCFCCKLFSQQTVALTSTGFDDWANTSVRLTEHEKSRGHLQATVQWLEAERRLNKECTLDHLHQQRIKDEKTRWQNVFQRLFAVVQFLAEHNLAFRGSVDRVFQPHNGNFLGLVELIAKFDPVMQEHLRRIMDGEIHDHYLGHRIQNELVQLMADNVKNTIVDRVKCAKYYSVILDCTPDLSHKEQMSLTIRCVSDGSGGVPVGIYEHFVEFLVVEESTGKNLLDVLLEQLTEIGLDFNDIRGQGYDNGSNMKGYKSGVQARLLEMNPRAIFSPCACHSYNLLLGDLAKICPDAMTFFGIIQRIYVMFSASTQRWTIFTNHVKGLSVKPLSDTRWECRVNSVKAVRYQLPEIYDALVEVAETTNDTKARSEATSLSDELKDFKFIVSIVFWYAILFQVNLVSKQLQAEAAHLSVAVSTMERTLEWLRNYRKDGFQSALGEARDIAEELETEPVFKQARIIRRKRQFAYEGRDEPVDSPQANFEVNCFNLILDKAVSSMESRFDQLKKHNDLFGFIYSFQDLTKADLKKHSAELEKSLTANGTSDIDGNMLAEEMDTLKTFLAPEIMSQPLKVLSFLHDMKSAVDFPNFWTALRILLTIPVTVASGERSFSKLKLIKTYLRSTMSQERLNGLAILSIENEVASQLDYRKLIDDFASAKSRKIRL